MSSMKSDTNKKWTSSDKYRDNWDSIFKKEESTLDYWEDEVIYGYGLYDSSDEANELKAKYQKRLQYNLEILEILKDFFTKNPELRFGQVITILELNFFNEESGNTLSRLREEHLKFLQADKGVF